MRYSVVLFDADDTLFDYKAAERAAFFEVAAALGVSGGDFEPALQRYAQINQACWERYQRGEISQSRLRVARFEQWMGEMGILSDAQQVAGSYLDVLGRQSQTLPGAAGVLRALHGKVRIGVVTNGITHVQKNRLANSPLKAYIEAMVVSEEVEHPKPHPRMFELALERLSAPHARDALMVGDSLTSDIAGGAAAGLSTCWFNPGGKDVSGGVRPTYEIRALEEVLGIVLM